MKHLSHHAKDWRRRFDFLSLCCCLTVLGSAVAQAGAADTTALSLEQAIQRALTDGEEVKIAQAQVDLAEAQVKQARADVMPQLSVSLGYNRQIRSIFSGSGFGGGGTGLQFLPFQPDSTAPLDQRVRTIEQALPTAGLATLFNSFSNAPFGRTNTWTAGLTIQQTLFEGSKLWTAPRVAGQVRDAADAQFQEQQWEIARQVKRAYYDALLAGRIVEIARMSLDQAERQLDQVQRQHQAGNLSDFDLLQAEVQRDNQGPEVVNADNQHELALLNLKRLINLPATTQVRLTSGFIEDTAGEQTPDRLPSLAALLERSKARPAVEAATFEMQARGQVIKIAKADQWPRLSVSSAYNRQAFPSGLFPRGGDWRTDWGVGVTMSLSLFDGLRTQGKVHEARANVALARERLAQVEEGIALTVEQAYRDLNRAAAQIDARQRTIGQAERAFRLAELRYEQGISTPLEVADARLQLQRARINHAQALHDYSIALVELERAAGMNLSGVSSTLNEPR